MKHLVLSGGYGFVAGGLAGATFGMMNLMIGVIWPEDPSRLRIVLTIAVGACLIALLQHWMARYDDDAHDDQGSLADQVTVARDPLHLHRKRAALIALIGITAVSFGGAIGPEAGILALVSQLSAIVAHYMRRDQEAARIIGEAGVAGALGGFYGSPPGGAVYGEESLQPSRLLGFVAATTGLLGLLGLVTVAQLFPAGAGLRLNLPAPAVAEVLPQFLMSLLPALAGVAVGVLFILGEGALRRALARLVPQRPLQCVIGGLAFALLAGLWPLLRFSGHHEFDTLVAPGFSTSAGLLVAVALLKVLALSLCLAAGWLGGSILPLSFAATALGLAIVAVVPGIDPAIAIIASIGAAGTIGIGKPLPAFLVLLFMIGTDAPLALMIGVVCGAMALSVLPDRKGH